MLLANFPKFHKNRASSFWVCDRTAPDRLRDRDNAAGIADDAAGIIDIATNVIPWSTPYWMETGVTLFLEDKFQRGKKKNPKNLM